MQDQHISVIGMAICGGLLVCLLTACPPRDGLAGLLRVSRIITTNPPDVFEPNGGAFPFVLCDGTDHCWDFSGLSTVVSGSNPSADTELAFDGFGHLRIDGSSQLPLLIARLEDDREIIYGPMRNGDFIVTRKVYVSEDGGFARWLEILENRETDMEIRANVEVGGFLGRMDTTPAVDDSTDGDTVLDGNDIWWIRCQDVDTTPCVGGLTCGGTMRKEDSEFIYDYGPITVPPGERVILVHFLLMRSEQDVIIAPKTRGTSVHTRGISLMPPPDEQLRDALTELETFPVVPPVYLEGMTMAELNDVRFCGGNVLVRGLPASVAANAFVIVRNLTSGDSVAFSANGDGAWETTIGGNANDRIEVESDDGQTVRRRVP